MGRWLNAVLCVLLAGLVLIGQRPVLAAFSPVNISNTAAPSTFPSLGLNGTGLMAVWIEGASGNGEIYLGRSSNNGVGWSAGVNLSETAAPSREYDWAFAGRDVYVAWSDKNTGNFDILVRRSKDGGVTWEPRKNITKNAGHSSLPAIAVAGENVYLAWQDATGGTEAVDFARSVDSGGTYSTPVRISNASTAAFAPRMVAFGPHVYVVWTELLSNRYDVMLRRSSDGGATFGPIVNVSNTGTTNSIQPAFAVAGSNVYVVYVEAGSTSHSVLLRKSLDGGASFGSAIVVGTSDHPLKEPQVVTAGRFMFVLWRRGGGVSQASYRRSVDGGATWGTQLNLSNSSTGVSGGRMTLAGMLLHVVYADLGVGAGDIMYRASSNAGGSFGNALNLSADAGVSQNPVPLAVGGDAYVVWQDNTSGNDEILFVKSSSGSFTASSGSLAGGGSGWVEGRNPAVPNWCAVPKLCPEPATIK